MIGMLIAYIIYGIKALYSSILAILLYYSLSDASY